MRRRLPILAVGLLVLSACTIEIPVTALLPPPRSGVWEFEHKGDGTIYEIVLEFERGGNLKIWDLKSVERDEAERDYEDTSDPKMRRWSHETKLVEFLHCPPRSSFCGFYTMRLVSDTRLEGYMVKLPPDGDKIHRVDYVASYKNGTLPSRFRPSPSPEASEAPVSPAPSPSPSTTPSAKTPSPTPEPGPSMVILQAD